MTVAGPFFELHVRQPREPLPLARGDGPPEHAQTGHVEAGGDRVGPGLQVGWIRAQRRLPVADDDVLVHLMRLEHERTHRLRDPLQPEAVLERLPSVAETGPAQRRLEAVQELREGPDVWTVVDDDN